MPEAQLQPGDDLKQVPVIKMVHDLAARYHLINFLGRPTTVDRIDYHVAPIDKETAKHHWGKYAVEQAPYLNGVTTDHPDNFNYRFIIGNKLNRNYPLPYTAKPGGWKTIERTLRHVFGEYYEQMLEYHAVMLKYPEWKLPVILLLSSHNETGKSSVMELTAKMMGQNAKKIRSGDITNKFTGAWVNAQFGYVDEQSTGLEKWKQNPIIKDLCTAETAISEDKGRPTEQIKCNLKLWMASNDVFTAFPVELEDKRIWPILVEKIDRNNMINRAAYKALLEQEIPAYMYYLLNEIEINLSSPHRTYFDPDIYMNDLKIGIINQSKSSASQSIAEVLTKIFSQNLK
ncbi:MAG TPA: primase-helicase family protein, partial [Methanosarcinales archaeon]|nr:primase-helicase family protein [Methanosarcinales archaeon]